MLLLLGNLDACTVWAVLSPCLGGTMPLIHSLFIWDSAIGHNVGKQSEGTGVAVLVLLLAACLAIAFALFMTDLLDLIRSAIVSATTSKA